MGQYQNLMLYTALCSSAVIAILILARLLGPHKKTRTKQQPFECGTESESVAENQRFSAKYYLVAVLFVIFDAEVLFTYPWAVSFKDTKEFVAIALFLGTLFISFVYALRKGILDWNKR